MENGVHSSYHRSCVVISGDSLEDWKYIFRELKFRVGVSVQILISPIFNSKLRKAFTRCITTRIFLVS